ncbi:hypothetical protein JTB14_010746 [Gonioctena quinquepunctata]|nr:hypothetical protein JTB14_010746 [Gonioctena quinquepunctata]
MCLFNGQSSFSRNLCRRWCSSVFVIIVFCLSLNASEKNVNRITREVLSDSLQNYLMNFGYMEKSGDGAFALRTEETIRKSLSEMQAFAGLPVTGQLDERTKKLMATPRCGLPDRDLRPRRSKRFTIHGPKWPYTRLKWR